MDANERSGFLRLQKEVLEQYGRRLAQAAAQTGLTRPEADVLLFLDNNAALDTARDVVHYRGFSKAYVSGAIEGLVRKGLLNERVDASDRRAHHLVLTQAAKAAAQPLHQAQEGFISRLTQGMTPQEREALLALLQKIQKNIAEMEKEERTWTESER